MFDVVIPTYQIRPELIERCLASIQTQQLVNSVVIVDGTPSTWDQYEEFYEVIAGYYSKLPLTYLRQTGIGVSQARNQGVKASTSDYIAFLDGDDWWYPEHLSELALAIQHAPAKSVLFWNPMDTEVVMKTAKNEFRSKKLCNYFQNWNQWNPQAHWLYIWSHPVFPSSVAVLKSRFLEVGGFPEDLFSGEDVVCWVLMLQTGYLAYQNDFVGGYHDLQHEFGGDGGFFAKNQHPLNNLYGDLAETKFQENLDSRSKYFVFPTQKPTYLTDEEWEYLQNHNRMYVYHSL